MGRHIGRLVHETGWLVGRLVAIKKYEIMDKDFSNLARPLHSMPDFVRQALEERGLIDDYLSRPAYQQNDYIGWIKRAKRQATKEKRLAQMLDELKKGGVYMNMDHPPSRRD